MAMLAMGGEKPGLIFASISKEKLVVDRQAQRNGSQYFSKDAICPGRWIRHIYSSSGHTP